MTTGVVNALRKATVEIVIHNATEQPYDLEIIVDNEEAGPMASNEQPPPQDNAGTPGQQTMSNVHFAALVTAMITLVVCSMEMIPGWGFLRLGWPRTTFYSIVAFVGAAAGIVLAPHRFAGLISGALAMAGALHGTALILDNVDRIPNLVLVIVAAIGSLPGFGLYLGWVWIYERLFRRGGDQPESGAGTDPGDTSSSDSAAH
jgi:hypothetical protein